MRWLQGMKMGLFWQQRIMWPVYVHFSPLGFCWGCSGKFCPRVGSHWVEALEFRVGGAGL